MKEVVWKSCLLQLSCENFVVTSRWRGKKVTEDATPPSHIPFLREYKCTSLRNDWRDLTLPFILDATAELTIDIRNGTSVSI